MAGKRTISPEVEAAVVSAYASGRRSGEIAKEFEINRKTVTTIVRRNGGEVAAQQIASGRRPQSVEHLHPEIRQLREEGMSQQAIAERLGVGQPTVSRALRSMGMPSDRGQPKGSDHWAWKGGRLPYGDGYWIVWVDPSDPMAAMATKQGYVLEHRLVMARSLGRPLARTETVHHVNGDHGDNRLSNLQLRQGRHGKGASFRCSDCGSCNVVPVELADTGAED